MGAVDALEFLANHLHLDADHLVVIMEVVMLRVRVDGFPIEQRHFTANLVLPYLLASARD